MYLLLSSVPTLRGAEGGLHESDPGLLVTVWGAPPLLVHCTVWPTEIMALAGEKKSSRMLTWTVPPPVPPVGRGGQGLPAGRNKASSPPFTILSEPIMPS